MSCSSKFFPTDLYESRLVKERADIDDRRDLYLGGALTINGQLHCKKDLEVKGNVYLKPGSQLIVDGKRTIHGSLKEKD